MTGDGVAQSRAGWWASFAALFASSGTLICCALPALLVALGAGAALSSLVSTFPQIVWLSEYKVELFVAAGVMLSATGWLQWANRGAPCPTDPALRDACLKTRRASRALLLASVAIYAVGGFFAFALPALTG